MLHSLRYWFKNQTNIYMSIHKKKNITFDDIIGLSRDHMNVS